MTTVNSEKLSSARFAQATDAFVEVFTASVDFDKRMAEQDIQQFAQLQTQETK